MRSSHSGYHAMSGHRRAIRRNAALVLGVVVALALSLLTGPAASAAPTAAGSAWTGDHGNSRGALTIRTPAPDSIIRRADLAAAQATRVQLSATVGRGVSVTAVYLNGTPVNGFRVNGNRLVGELTAAVGLRSGVNKVRIEGAQPGQPLPVNAVSTFVVGYRATDLVDLTVQQTAPGVMPTATLALPDSGVHKITVTVNGRDATDAVLARRTHRGSADVALSAADYLRKGRNSASITVIMTDGRTQTTTRDFTLDRRRAVPGVRVVAGAGGLAGPDGPAGPGEAVVGQQVQLDASSSLVPSGRLAGRDVSWQLVGRPVRSQVALAGGTGLQVGLTPDVPGTYRVQVTVRTGSQSGTATVSLSATPSSPLVPLNSLDTSTSPAAVVVDGNRYAPGGDLQVVVLDRLTLEYLDAKGFTVDSAGLSSLGTYLKGLPNTDLVFVTHASTAPVISASNLTALNTALGYIGGGWPGYWLYGNNQCWSGEAYRCVNDTKGWQRQSNPAAIGSFSIAGVPGMGAGQAWRSTAVQSRATEGRISGYLTRGTAADQQDPDNYVIVAGADQYVQVDTCASGAPSACAIQVGDQTYPPTAGANGMNLVVLDRTTRTLITHQTVTSIDQLVVALQGSNVTTSIHLGNTIVASYSDDDQRIVLLQSVGTGKLGPSNSNIMPFIDHYGGTPEAFLTAFTNGTPYGMVGVGNKLPWHGTATESSPTISAKQSGRLRTVLSRDRDWRLTPFTGDTYGGSNLELFSVMYQNATPWSYVGDPAVAYIGQNISLPSDVRSAYTIDTVEFASKAALLDNLTCSDTTVCGPNFAAVKQQLLVEFDAVESVRQLISNLEYPFLVSGQSQAVDVKTTYDKIVSSIKPPPTAPASFDFLTFFTESTSIGGAIAFALGLDDLGVGLGLLSAVGEFTQDVSPDPDTGDSTDTLKGEVDQLDAQLTLQTTSYLDALGRMEIILVSDAGKLATVGTKVGTDPAWGWTQETLIEAITALNANALSQSYTAILPAAWGLFNLTPDFWTQMTSNDVTKYECIGQADSSKMHAMWAGAPATNQLHAHSYVDTSNKTYVDEVWTFANVDTSNDAKFLADPYTATAVPSADLTSQLFSSTTTGGFQYGPQWFRETYNPPGVVMCSTNKLYASLAWASPVVPNQQAARTN